jgi:hypothetical protein
MLVVFGQFSTRKRMPYKQSVGFFGINWYKTKSQGIKWAQEKCCKDKRLTLIKLESILCFTIGLDFEACLFHSACWRVDNPLKPEQVTVIENSSRSIEGRVLETGINISIKNLPTVFESLVFRTEWLIPNTLTARTDWRREDNNIYGCYEQHYLSLYMYTTSAACRHRQEALVIQRFLPLDNIHVSSCLFRIICGLRWGMSKKKGMRAASTNGIHSRVLFTPDRDEYQNSPLFNWKGFDTDHSISLSLERSITLFCSNTITVLSM